MMGIPRRWRRGKTEDEVSPPNSSRLSFSPAVHVLNPAKQMPTYSIYAAHFELLPKLQLSLFFQPLPGNRAQWGARWAYRSPHGIEDDLVFLPVGGLNLFLAENLIVAHGFDVLSAMVAAADFEMMVEDFVDAYDHHLFPGTSERAGKRRPSFEEIEAIAEKIAAK